MLLGYDNNMNFGNGSGIMEGKDVVVLVDGLYPELAQEHVFAILITSCHDPVLSELIEEERSPYDEEEERRAGCQRSQATT